MRTIKTYFKGAPFYIASRYRNVAFSREYPNGRPRANPKTTRRTRALLAG